MNGLRVLTIILCATVALPARAQTVLFTDDFEDGNTLGWTTATAPDEPSVTGIWTIGDPVGTFSDEDPSQPEDPANGAGCAFTAQNPAGLVGDADVDFGAVFLISPAIDLSSVSSVELTYTRWYYLRDLEEDNKDYFRVEVRESPISPWVIVEDLGNSQPYNSWATVSFSLDPFITLSPASTSVQLRISASDSSLQSNIVEAAVDDIRIIDTSGCETDAECGASEFCDAQGVCLPYGSGDMDNDGDIDLEDLRAFQCCFETSAAAECLPANLAGSAIIGNDDAIEIISRMNGPQ